MGEELKGRVALVTGGGRGIGRAIAQALYDAGASVAIVDNGATMDGRDPDATVAPSAAADLGPFAQGLALDISDPDQAEAAVARTVEAMGGLDIVVNNAAILRDAFVFKQDPADWDAVIQNNLTGAFYMLRAATPVLREQAKAGRGDGNAYRWGRILNITSTVPFYGQYGQAAYASAKAGLVGMMRIAALDMARAGVTANAIAPFAATRMTDTVQPMTEEQKTYKENALKADPRHVGALAAWLASDAGAETTGQLFGIRGREIFLFSLPRPVARFAPEGPEDWSHERLTEAMATQCDGLLADGLTDLEVFAGEPV